MNRIVHFNNNCFPQFNQLVCLYRKTLTTEIVDVINIYPLMLSQNFDHVSKVMCVFPQTNKIQLQPSKYQWC